MLTLKEQTMLGNIPSDWQAKPLIDLLDDHLPGDWGDDAGPDLFKVLRSTNLTNRGRLDFSDVALRALPPKRAALFAPKYGDILLERSGGGPGQPVGRVGFVERDLPGYGYSNFLHLLRTDSSKINPRFLAWTLYQINRTGRIIRLEQQTTQLRNLHFRDYLTMRVAVPTSDEQPAIARVLDAVDQSIGRARDALERAKELKQAISQRAFSEGVRGEQQRKTSLGFIPKSWMVKPVGEVVKNFEYGLSLAMSLKGQVPILRMGNIQAGNVVLDGLKYVTLPEKLLARYLLRRGDVLFNRTNSQEHVGKIGIYRSDEPAVFASYLIRLHPAAGHVDPYFLGHILSSYQTQCRIKRYATPGVQQVNINAKNLGKVLIPVPVGPSGFEEQKEIAALLEHAEARIQSYEPVLKTLEQLKKSLLHDLLTGTVRLDPALFAETHP